jgi:opacity protein-like surface antigen
MKNGIIILAIAGSLSISLSAFANKGATYHAPVQEKEKNQGAWYIGAGVNGSSQFSMNAIPGVTAGGAAVSQSTGPTVTAQIQNAEYEQDSADLGFDVYVGYDINKYWAAEVGYTYVGQITYDIETSSEVVRSEAEVKQWNAHVVGIGKLPVGDYVNFFLKGGIAYYANKTEFENVNNNGSETYTADQTSDTMALTYGAGAELHWENWGIRGEYNVIYPANNVRDDFAIADIISANIYYKFM